MVQALAFWVWGVARWGSDFSLYALKPNLPTPTRGPESTAAVSSHTIHRVIMIHHNQAEPGAPTAELLSSNTRLEPQTSPFQGVHN